MDIKYNENITLGYQMQAYVHEHAWQIPYS
jgi:hypothetical protein